MTTRCSSKLIIFEGPDGAGKTTLAKQVAHVIGAKYVHFNALPRVTTGLARMYVEAMLPALLGYQHVVFDRSWLSEAPYGNAFRDGADRLGDISRSMLERIAMRCETTLVLSRPKWETCRANYLIRKQRDPRAEYLENEQQLRAVYDSYSYLNTGSALPTVMYDYEQGLPLSAIVGAITSMSTRAHDLAVSSAGFLRAPFVLVGDEFAERKNQDPWYQAPFVSFTDFGCSGWLTSQLIHAGVRESQLLWVNADQPLEWLKSAKEGVSPKLIFALGDNASAALSQASVEHIKAPHPQYWKRFKASSSYPLIDYLKGV